jgi:hypothetical protein
MDRNDDATEKHRFGGRIGSRQGQKKAAFDACGAPLAFSAAAVSGRAALRHPNRTQPDFSHP